MEEEDNSVKDDAGLYDDDDNVDAILNRRKSSIKKEEKPKEEIMKVAFILDRIPSYLIVISRVQGSVSQDPNSSDEETEVA